VRRDEEIENFKPQDFWSVSALLADPGQPDIPFWAKWLPAGVEMADLEKAEAQGEGDPVEAEEDEDDEAQPQAQADKTVLPAWLLPPNRITDRAVAERIAQQIRDAATAQVIGYENKPAKESAPLPFELTGLQAAMNQRHGAGAQQTLDACQSLYEKGYASYP